MEAVGLFLACADAATQILILLNRRCNSNKRVENLMKDASGKVLSIRATVETFTSSVRTSPQFSSVMSKYFQEFEKVKRDLDSLKRKMRRSPNLTKFLTSDDTITELTAIVAQLTKLDMQMETIGLLAVTEESTNTRLRQVTARCDSMQQSLTESSNASEIHYRTTPMPDRSMFGVLKLSSSDYRVLEKHGTDDSVCIVDAIHTAGRSLIRKSERQSSLGKDELRGFRFIKMASDLGHPGALREAGDCYFYGTGVRKNLRLAVTHYEKGAAQGSVVCHYGAGYCYLTGCGVEKDVTRALDYYEMSSERGHSASTLALADCYSHAIEVAANHGRAKMLYERAVRQGFSGAHVGLADLESKSSSVDEKLVLKYYRNCIDCDADFTLASFAKLQLAHRLRHGIGTEKNEEEAGKYLRASREYPEWVWKYPFKMTTGLHYEYGVGVPKDFYAAVEYYEDHAENGDCSSLLNLGLCYEMGNGVKQSYRDALQCYVNCADRGSAFAQMKVGLILEDGIGVQRDLCRSFTYYRMAAKQSELRAQIKVGSLYAKGIGVACDINKARHYYKKAADQGDENARHEYKLLRRSKH